MSKNFQRTKKAFSSTNSVHSFIQSSSQLSAIKVNLVEIAINHLIIFHSLHHQKYARHIIPFNPLTDPSFSILNEAKYLLMYHQGALWVVEHRGLYALHVVPDII